MHTFKTLWQAMLMAAATLPLTSSNALGATFSGYAFDPGKIDAAIPGFVGPDGVGNITSNNRVNPLFTGWATDYQDYRPAPGVLEQWQTPERALGPVTGAFDGIVSLGELTAEQIDAAVMPGQITLTFDSPIQNGEGADFAVFENGFGFADTGKLFAELAFVEVSSNGSDFLRFPSISSTPDPLEPFGQLDPTQVYNLAGKHLNNGIVLPDDQFVQASWGTPFDLEVLADIAQPGLVDLNSINFVRIVDISGNGAFVDSEGRPIYDPWQTTIPGSGGFDLEAVGVINAQAVPEPTSLLALSLAGVLGISLRRSSNRAKSSRRA
ncbi:MAG: PEP-CTERM sorting domain-containing protein [Cyanobacteria bacterium J06554_6]